MKAVIVLAVMLFVHDMPTGCYRLASTDVSVVPGGYIVVALNHFVQEHEKSVSGDNHYWLCTAGRGDYHLFVPQDEQEQEL